ncbi:MAG: lysine--tRNA ligase [Limnochordia bacterium]
MTHDGGHSELSDQMVIRRQKVDEWREQRIEPFGGRFVQSHYSTDIITNFTELEGTEVSVAGRIRARRGHGKACFIDLQDTMGSIQLYAKVDLLGQEAYTHLGRLDIGDIIGVNGTVFRTNRGEISIEMKTFELLAKALRPLPEKWHGLKDVELRYRQRYLDLITNSAARKVFESRSKIIKAMREFLENKGFLEVETPMLHPVLGGANARPFVTYHNALDMSFYLRIAPELYLKKLLVGGIDRVFEIGKNFRNEGVSTKHNPEFTAMEAYWAYADFEDMMRLTEELTAYMAVQATGSTVVEYQGMKLDFTPPWPRMSMNDSVKEHTGLDILSMTDSEAVTQARNLGVSVKDDATVGEVLNAVFEDKVEEHLVQPTYITHHPVDVSPLAKRNAENPLVTDRFEAYANTWEILNGFSELNDPIDQRGRFERQMEARARGDEEAQELDEDFLEALEYGMPPAAGLGIGIDRLVMLLTNSASIRDVLLFPHMRPRD